jgi:dihydroorotate dehydrogenase
MNLSERYQTFVGEGLKSVSEAALHRLGQMGIMGEKIIELHAFDTKTRLIDPALETDVAGITFESPVLFGAGWDKKGLAVRGLYHLGFAGGEVGTVLPMPQLGNPRPRLWTIDKAHSVGINRMGFNSQGKDVVGENLDSIAPLPCPIGINVGRNKTTENDQAVWAHEQVIRGLQRHARYIALGISSPNSPGLRKLQDPTFFRDVVQGAQEAMDYVGYRVPLFAKIDGQRSHGELDGMIEIMLEEGGAGIVTANTYSGVGLKGQYNKPGRDTGKYGRNWEEEAGGLSGADPYFRKLATESVRYIYEQAGDELTVMGVGGVDSAETALEKIQAGASAIQIVTAIRPSKGRVAARTVVGLSEYLEREGIASIKDLIGANTQRGVKAAAA